MTASPMSRGAEAGESDALAKLAEIPPAGSEERMRWLEAAGRHVSGVPSNGFGSVFLNQGILTLMSEARKQGQRDVLGGMLGGNTEDEQANALKNCAEAIAFFDQVKRASPAEQNAVCADHWNWLESACRRAAALATGGARHG